MQRRSQTYWRFLLFQAGGISDHSSEALACHYPFGVGLVFQPFWSKIVDSWTNSVDRQGLSFDLQGHGLQIDPRAPCCRKLVSAEKNIMKVISRDCLWVYWCTTVVTTTFQNVQCFKSSCSLSYRFYHGHFLDLLNGFSRSKSLSKAVLHG